MRIIFTKEEIHRVYKAKRKPEFVRDAVMLKNILTGAWADVSPDFVDSLLTAFKSGQVSEIRNALKGMTELSGDFGDKIDKKVDALAISLQNRAEAYYISRLGKDAKSIPEDRKTTIQDKWAEEVKNFSTRYPERVLHPEIERMITNLQEGRYVDVAQISDRVKDLLDNNPATYFEGLSDAEANRAFQETSVNLASENGYTQLMWTALGPSPCSVCDTLDGTIIEVEAAKDRFDAAQDISDPDEVSAHWSFPRLADVDNKNREDLTSDCNCPPAHPSCWCQLVALS
jgi:hypothetical protein